MKKFKSIFAFIGAIKGKLGKNPEFDWYFALSAFVVAALIAVAVDGFIFASLVAAPKSDDVPLDLSALSINKENIDEAIKSIENDDLNSSIIPDISLEDPSLKTN